MNDLSELIKRSMFFDTIKDVYSYDLMDMKDIAIELDIWDSLTEEKKELYNKYSKSNVDERTKYKFDRCVEEIKINNNIKEVISEVSEQFSDDDDKLIYGEITKSGVDTLLKEIKKRKSITSDDVFYDIGSGNGKLPIHIALISEFSKVKGIEISDIRYMYSNHILKNTVGSIDNIEFINDDVRNIDISDATVIFINDVLFTEEDVEHIFEKASKGTHIISFKKKSDDIINLDVSWYPLPSPFNYHIK
jgi:SAM-dependent methyltransferase